MLGVLLKQAQVDRAFLRREEHRAPSIPAQRNMMSQFRYDDSSVTRHSRKLVLSPPKNYLRKSENVSSSRVSRDRESGFGGS